MCEICETAPVMPPSPWAADDHTETICLDCNDGTPNN